MAALYQDQGRYADAEPPYKRGLAIREKALGPNHPDVALSLSNLAGLYQALGRTAEAEPHYKRSLAIRERALGPDHPDVALSLNNLATFYGGQGRAAEAEPLHKRSLAIYETAMGPEHPIVAKTLDNLAWLAFGQGDWARAAEHWRRSTGIVEGRTRRGLSGDTEGSAKGEAQRSSWYFVGLAKMTYRLAAEGRRQAAPAAEMFETAQWAQASEAAASLAQMAARSATASPELAEIVRERQDLMREVQVKGKRLIAEKSKAPAQRDAGTEKALAGEIATIDSRLDAIKERLDKGFPEYTEFASPAPVSVPDVQAQLRDDEALVLFLDTTKWGAPWSKSLPEETFVWVVTRSQVRWVRSELGTAGLRREVEALRCGLDNALWDDVGKAERCAALLGMQRYDTVVNVLPFDLARAHKLYKDLLGEVEDLIAGKHLLIVPSGPLTQLPFQVLVTEPPKVAIPDDPAGYREVSWLGARQPITVLPAVSSLKALRAHAKASRAAKAYLGIGNPLLDGDPADADDVARAKLARTNQACARAPIEAAMTLAGPVRGGVARVATPSVLTDVAAIKRQAPLPETAVELCTVALELKADTSEMRLGARATEAEVKRLSADEELAKYHVLHFATHGVMAGELKTAREPGLILTPPEQASEKDDGYLSASEIAALKLDADWVVLSACNTAAGGASSAEALSGVARAFIYAGARALLVSHWAVYSEATVKLITGAVGEMSRDPKVGRAEAMRRSMVALIDKGTPEEAHPAFWAPFVVVGEGAAAR